ncbi:hypothetical protein ACTFIY_006313 [Dictyostelium cf. discoideum]
MVRLSYYNPDKDCLRYLFKWKRVDLVIVKLIFKTFENEIKSLKINNNHKYFQYLIENENIEILKLLLFNSLPLQYLPQSPTKEERNRLFKSKLSNYLASYSKDLILNPTYPMEQVIEFFNFLSSLSIIEPPLMKFVTNGIVCTILIKDSKRKFKPFIEKLEKPSIIFLIKFDSHIFFSKLSIKKCLLKRL